MTNTYTADQNICCRHNGQDILRGVDSRRENNQQIIHNGYFLWNHEEAAATTRVPRLHVREQTRQISGVPQRRGKVFATGFIEI